MHVYSQERMISSQFCSCCHHHHHIFILNVFFSYDSAIPYFTSRIFLTVLWLSCMCVLLLSSLSRVTLLVFGQPHNFRSNLIIPDLSLVLCALALWSAFYPFSIICFLVILSSGSLNFFSDFFICSLPISFNTLISVSLRYCFLGSFFYTFLIVNDFIHHTIIYNNKKVIS